MKKLIGTTLLAFCMAPAVMIAQGPPPPPGFDRDHDRGYDHGPRRSGPGLFIQIAPPPPPRERPGPPPEPGFVWINGYQNWDGRGYAWIPGHYERAPRPRAVWVPHHWAHQRGGWMMVEGHWR
jgi:hypothetical protein